MATLGPVARADDGRAADNGPLLSGQQVEVVVIVEVVVVVLLQEVVVEVGCRWM